MKEKGKMKGKKLKVSEKQVSKMRKKMKGQKKWWGKRIGGKIEEDKKNVFKEEFLHGGDNKKPLQYPSQA